MLAGPIWLGDNSSVTKQVIERLYGCSHLLNDAGQYAYYGRVGGCLITGNEDGVKHCAMNVLYSLQHLGYTIPPQADAGWIGEAGPGPSYLDPGSGGPSNDFTNRNTTFMTWNLMHLARMLKDAGGIPAHGNQRSEWDAGCRFDLREPRAPLTVSGALSTPRTGRAAERRCDRCIYKSAPSRCWCVASSWADGAAAPSCGAFGLRFRRHQVSRETRTARAASRAVSGMWSPMRVTVFSASRAVWGSAPSSEAVPSKSRKTAPTAMNSSPDTVEVVCSGSGPSW